MDSLEEGEILDSDPDVNDVEEAAIANEAVVQSTSAAAISSQAAAGAAPRWTAARCPGLSSSEDEDESSDDSDDEHHRPSEKRSRSFAPSKGTEDIPFRNPLLAQPQESAAFPPATDMWNKLGARPKKSNNSVWSCVLQEQTLTRTIGSFGVENTDYLKNSDRDVESYDYKKSLLDPRHTKPNYEDDMFEEDTPGDKEDETEPQLVDVESFGFDANLKPASAKLRLGKRTDKKTEERKDRGSVDVESGERASAFERLGSAKHSSDEVKDMDVAEVPATESGTDAANAKRSIQERLGTQESSSARKRKHKLSASERLGERSFDKSKSRQHIKVTVDDPPDEVACMLMDVLDEPAYMEELWKHIPETLGNKLALELLFMTEDLEEVGGLWINNGNRRRTPGGVYLHLLKEAKNVTDEQKKHIFDWDKNKKYKAKKSLKKRSIRRKQEQTQDWVDRAKSEMGGDYMCDLKLYAEKKKRLAKKKADGDVKDESEKDRKESSEKDMKEESVECKERGMEEEEEENNAGMEDDQDNLDISFSGEGDIVLELD